MVPPRLPSPHRHHSQSNTELLPAQNPDKVPKPTSRTSRISLLSSSHSNEADDEQSSSSSSTMGPRHHRYPGEDVRPTSQKELSGFYMYAWAAEVFVVCGIGSFIPMTLEQLARERGVLLRDRTTPCKARDHFPDVQNMLSQRAPSGEAGQCVIYILGQEINTASFAMYTFSVSVLLQALLIISMSGAADHGRFRKTFLILFAFTGAIATMLFLPITPNLLMIGALLAIIANTCFGASFVLLNSFLPLLVRHHPTVLYADQDGSEEASLGDNDEEDGDDDDGDALVRAVRAARDARERETVFEGIADSTTALLGGRSTSAPDLTVPSPISASAPSDELALSTRISSYGIGIGYIAAVIVQCLSIFVLVLSHSTTFSLRLVLFMIGAWWLVFTVPVAFWLRPRPGPPLHTALDTRLKAFTAYFTYSWKSIAKTAVRARRLRDVLLFLGGWFLLSDGIATVGGTAVLFAKTSLDMAPASVALISVIVTLSGVVGAFAWSRLSYMVGLRPTQTILACLCLFELIPLYGLLGYIPAIQRLGVIGLQQPWEMYPLGAIYGFALGGISSYCRSLFGELIPPGYEAAFYALYAITDKGSSVFGPAIVGAITDATGEIRPAFGFLALLVGCTFPLMAFVDVERGRREGLAMAKELEAAVEGVEVRSHSIGVLEDADLERESYED